MSAPTVAIDLSVVVMAPMAGETAVLTLQPGGDGVAGLPSGPFDPQSHRTFELALRDFVTRQTGLDMGFVEQLYTFGDAGRETPQVRAGTETGERIVSVGYLALAPTAVETVDFRAAWKPWQLFFPYEDWRRVRPPVIDQIISPALYDWAGSDEARLARARSLFALNAEDNWRDERVLERYELLYEAGLTIESNRDRAHPQFPGGNAVGQPLQMDHRRILATGLGRLRGKLRYRPVIFDLLPEEFTLSQLQRAVESVTGQPMHKQNFRRSIERTALVERTGRIDAATGGRPAELFRYRPAAASEAPALGLTLPIQR